MERTHIATTQTNDLTQDAPLLLSADKVAQLLGISIRTLWRLRAAGKLPTPVRLGGSVRWRLNEIQSWIATDCPPRSLESRQNKQKTSQAH